MSAVNAVNAPQLAHVDDHCIVAIKPSGLLSVPGRGPQGADCLWSRVQACYADALAVHRLDMSTSGLMLFARHPVVHRDLRRAFAQREVLKRYVAVVHGQLADDAGEIDLPLAADWPHRPRQHVDRVHGKPSLTRYRVLGRDTAHDTTRVELEPFTGRAHQLRVHLLALGHPILGDALYAPPVVHARSPRLMLHASALGFTHPVSGQTVRLESPPPF